MTLETFLSAAALLLAAPGPTNALLFASGASAGLQRSAPAILAALLAYATAIAAIFLVAGPLLASHPDAARILRYALCLYLLYLARKIWIGSAASQQVQAVRPLDVFTITLLNPKALVLALVLLPSAATPSLEGPLAALALVIVIAATAWTAAGAACATSRAVSAGGLCRFCALCLTGFAVLLSAT